MGEKKLKARETILLGLTIFSMFFGAGNLIFPPFLALNAGENLMPSLSGFFFTAIILPLLGLIAVAKSDGLDNLASRVSPVFSLVLTIAIYLSIGPCLAIPRTASTSFEMLANAVNITAEDNLYKLFRSLYSVVFFLTAIIIARNPEKLTKKLGKVLCPTLLALILILFLGSFKLYTPFTTNANGIYKTNPFSQGFLDGYQTMDAIASLVFGMVIVLNAKALGIEDKNSVVMEEVKSGIIAAILLATVYSSLAFIGRISAYYWPNSKNGTEMLSVITNEIFSDFGSALIAAIFIIACLNTCVGLITSCANYFNKLFNKISYRKWTVAFALISLIISNAGLDRIISLSSPILSLLYPLVIVLIIFSFIPYKEDMRLMYIITEALTFASSAIEVFSSLMGISNPLSPLPFSSVGLTWLTPALLGVLISIFIIKSRRKSAE